MSNIGAHWADSWVWTSEHGFAALFHYDVPRPNLQHTLFHTVPLHHWPAHSSSLALLFMKSVSILKLLSQSKFSYQFWSSFNLALKLHWKSCVCWIPLTGDSARKMFAVSSCASFGRLHRKNSSKRLNSAMWTAGFCGVRNGRMLQCRTRRLKFELQTFAGQQLEKVLGQQNELNLLPTMLEPTVSSSSQPNMAGATLASLGDLSTHNDVTSSNNERRQHNSLYSVCISIETTIVVLGSTQNSLGVYTMSYWAPEVLHWELH